MNYYLKRTSLILLLIIVCLPKILKAQTNEKSQQPNILWIVTDDQRADSISAFNKMMKGQSKSELGQVLSPSVDRLARMGTIFINTFNQNPGCAPSQTLMHTGRYSHRTGVYGFEYYNPVRQKHWQPMVPEILRDQAGYQTLAVGKLGIRTQHFQGQKFGTEPPLYQTHLGYRKEFAAKGKVDWNSERKWSGGKPGPKNEVFYFPDGEQLIWPEHSDAVPNDRAEIQKRLGLLRQYAPGDKEQKGSILAGLNLVSGDLTRDGSFTQALLDHLAHEGKPHTDMLDREQDGPDPRKPLFAYIGFEFPHTPVLPPAEFREKFQKLKYEIPKFTKEELASFPPQLLKLYKNSQSDQFTESEKHQMISDYYAFCAYGDSLVGKAVDGFIQYSEKQERPWLILYVCGDHGWRLNEHGMVSKFSHYDIELHNPIIAISSDKSKFPAGKVVSDFTCFVDMAPTFLNAGGVDTDSSEFDFLDGLDLAQAVTEKVKPRDYIIAEPTWVIGPRAVIRTKDDKFAMKIRPRSGHTITSKTVGQDFKWAIGAELEEIEPTLYDLNKDPEERENLAFDGRYRPILDALRTKLQDIVLGDGRVEVAWTKEGNDPTHQSNFAPGSNDGQLSLPPVSKTSPPKSDGASSSQKEQPNIVLIFIDDMGYGDIGPFGNKINQTPHLDRMAKEGNVLRQFYVANTACTPSRSALLTGTYAARIGMDGQVCFPGEHRGLNPDEYTIAEMLKSRGYVTGCFGKWHLGDQPEFLPPQHGFDEYFGIPYSNDMWPGNTRGNPLTDRGPYTPLPVLRNNKVISYVSDGADQSLLCEFITNRALKFIEANKDQPFFCYVPHAYVHKPRYARPEINKKAEMDIDRANVEEVDTSVGRILSRLRKLKLDKKTLVIFTSDNGGAGGMSMGPLRGGKGGPKYEGHMREPTITWWPGTIPAGAETQAIAVTTDILPSMAKLVDAELPGDRKIDGKDALDVLLGKPNAKSPHPIHYYEVDAVRRGPWKLVRNNKKKFELYNLDEDLGEKNNLASTKPELVKELKAILQKHAEQIAADTRLPGFVKLFSAKPLISEPGDLPKLREYMGVSDTVADGPSAAKKK